MPQVLVQVLKEEKKLFGLKGGVEGLDATSKFSLVCFPTPYEGFYGR